MRKWILLLVCLPPLLAGAETTLNVGDIKVRGQAAFDQKLFHGYAEYHFTVENRSPNQAHEVRIDLTTPQGPSITKTVAAPPNSRLEFSMFTARVNGYFKMMATVDGRQTKEKTFSVTGSGYGYGRQGRRVHH